MRAANMQALTDAVKRRWPGAVVYGVGDAAHRLHSSDHNEDDTAGSKAAQSDADGNPEHRAIDIMVRGPFAKADADGLVARLLADPGARARLYGIIWNGSQWWRSTGFKREARTTDPHTDHVHVSGLASDDENAAGWPAVESGSGGVFTLFCKAGDNSEAVGSLQVKLKNLGFYKGAVDNDYGPATTAALKAASLKVNPTTTATGASFDKYTMEYVDALQIRKYAPAGTPGAPGAPGKQGPPGTPGKDGAPGKDGTLPASIRITGTAMVEEATS